MTATRFVRSKCRINALCNAILAILNEYPELSVNAVATATGWTQSSFQRALESREQDSVIAERTGRASVKDLVAEYGMERNFEAIEALLDAIQVALDLQTMAEEELPGYEPPAVKEPKAKRTKKSAEVADVADDDYEGDFEPEEEEVEAEDAYL